MLDYIMMIFNTNIAMLTMVPICKDGEKGQNKARPAIDDHYHGCMRHRVWYLVRKLSSVLPEYQGAVPEWSRRP